jgi:hypothetical protein
MLMMREERLKKFIMFFSLLSQKNTLNKFQHLTLFVKVGRLYLGCGGVDWIKLAQDRDKWQTLVNFVVNYRVTQNAGNFLTNCKPVSFSRQNLLHGVSE